MEAEEKDLLVVSATMCTRSRRRDSGERVCLVGKVNEWWSGVEVESKGKEGRLAVGA